MDQVLDKKMFCFQCEQTAACTSCTGARGVCGKPLDVALEQDALTGALVGLAKTCTLAQVRPESAARLIIEGLFTCVTNVDFDLDVTKAMVAAVNAEKLQIAQSTGIEPAENLGMNVVWSDNEDIRSLKSLILFGIRGMAAYAYHARMLGKRDDRVDAFFVKALVALGEQGAQDVLLPLVLEVGQANLYCMDLLDAANTDHYGNPEPTEVNLEIEAGPFIVVSGHDLKDLEELLQQTEGTGVSVYTHGEMLPAHAYPELKKYAHLKGNFGTAWQSQQKEFDNIPGSVLFTTNCLMPPRPSYEDRVFTTALVAYPGLQHVEMDKNGHKDFSAVIERARELGGYAVNHHMTGINGGTHVTTGFGHAAILSHAQQIVDAVKAEKISNFFLVGGCDGARPGRNYYTDFVKATPKDSVILTLACGKYRFNDLDLGTVAGLPRLLDVGQCNDAFGAVKVAMALAEAFDCSINELPLHFVLSWYEQKAVSVLLTLLYLGVKNIKLGPTLPAFVSPHVLDYLVKNFQIAPITTPEEDLAAMLA